MPAETRLNTTRERLIYRPVAGADGFAALTPRLVLIAEYTSVGRWYVPKLRHDCYTVSFVQEGNATVFVGGKKHSACRGAVLLYPPHTPYHAHNNPPYADYRTLILRFATGNADRLSVEFPEPSLDAVRHAAGMLAALAGKTPFDELTAKHLLIDIIGYAYGGKASGSVSRSYRAEEIIRASIDKPFSLARVAEAMRMSPSRFSHLFREETGTTPRHYYHLVKIEKAKTLLAGSDARVTDVADALGFSSIHHFTKLFTAVVGIPPSEYRMRLSDKTAQRRVARVEHGGPVA